MKNTDVVATVSVPVEITVARIEDLLCCAIEGGSNYWIDSLRRVGATEEQAEYIFTVPFVDGAYIELTEYADEENGETASPIKLDLDKIKTGIEVFANKYPNHFMNFINDNEDAETGDVFLQCCCFGKVIYS